MEIFSCKLSSFVDYDDLKREADKNSTTNI